MSQYTYGRKKELQVAEFLERRGFKKWLRSSGSKGPMDIVAIKGRTLWGIQVKSTRTDIMPGMDKILDKDLPRLIQQTKKHKLKPMLALVFRNDVRLVDLKSDKIILEGKLKPLQYTYPREVEWAGFKE